MEVNYIVNEQGKRELDKESQLKVMFDYLQSIGLYPFEDETEGNLKALSKNLCNNTNFKELCAIYIYKYDIHRAVFASLLHILSIATKRRVSCKVIDIQSVLQTYMKDSEVPLDLYTDVLCVMLNTTDFPHMYTAYCIRNLALSRKEKRKFTFFYFIGTKNEIDTRSKWMLDENGDGQKSVIWTDDGKNIDPRNLVKLSKFIQYVDLNALSKKDEVVNK